MSAPQEQGRVRAHDSIVSPVFDFFAVGGVSFLIIPFVMLPFWQETDNLEILTLVSYYLLFIFNLPHFMHSYQLLYRNYGEKVLSAKYSAASRIRHWIAGVAAPLAIISYLVYAFVQPTNDLMGYAVNIMLFFTGWHYVKQGYGIMITLSVRKKAFLDGIEKRILLINAYIAWIYAWIQLNRVVEKEGLFVHIPFGTVGFPDEVIDIANIAFLCWTFGVFAFFIKRFDGNRVVSINGMTAYFTSVYIWVAFAYSHPHIIIFVPAMHSLQYILIVWKMEYERNKEKIQMSGAEMPVAGGLSGVNMKRVAIAMLPFIVVGFGSGLLLITFLPGMLNGVIPYNVSVFGPAAFAFMFLIFMNIHHYFIDFAIWRKENPDMRYLFK